MQYTILVCVAGLAPKFSAVSGDSVVVKGENVTLKCNASGLPLPIMVWRKDGIIVQDTRRITKADGDSILNIRDTIESDAGWYTCEAGNYLNTITHSFQLSVQGTYI